MMKLVMKLIGVSVLAIFLTACGSSTQSENDLEQSASEVEKDEKETEVVTTTVEDVEAVYVGQLDLNSIEVKIDGEPNTFRLEELKDTDITTFEKDDKVKISYMIKSQQVKDEEIKINYLTKIEKMNN